MSALFWQQSPLTRFVRALYRRYDYDRHRCMMSEFLSAERPVDFEGWFCSLVGRRDQLSPQDAVSADRI